MTNELLELQGLGPASVEMLHSAGINTVDELRSLGSVAAYRKVCDSTDSHASLNLLYALEGALTGQHWVTVRRNEAARLLLELEPIA